MRQESIRNRQWYSGGIERHNAFEVDWDGNVWAQGSLEGTALILKSSTAGSEKRFVIRVNDEGQLSAQDIDTLNLVMTVNVPSGKTLSAVKDLYTEEEITAISGQENQYPVKYGRSYYVEYSYQYSGQTYTGEKTGMQCDRQHHGKHLTA